MARRSTTSQSKHDAAVRRIARSLERQGYEVEADVAGYSQPKTIGGYRPDVIGTKGKRREIVEVETRESVDSARDQGQQKAFSRAADRSRSTRFTRTVVR